MCEEFESKKRMVVWSLDAYRPDEFVMMKGVSMHPEFKAYVEAVCDTVDGVQPARVSRQPNRGVQPGSTTPKSFFRVIADFLEELPPYYCELKMVPGVKRIARQTSHHHDAIGYHGLV